jgi:hypothetical protein
MNPDVDGFSPPQNPGTINVFNMAGNHRQTLFLHILLPNQPEEHNPLTSDIQNVFWMVILK